MRIVVNHPGPNWSVADVHRGWVRGLRAAGAEVIEYAFHDRLWFFQNAKIERDGELVHAAPFDLATRLALEGLGAAIYETRPDAVMFVSGFWIRPEAMDGIRERGQKVILLCTESPYEDARQIELAEHADLTIINDPTNLERFRNVCRDTVYVPHSYDDTVHYPGPSEHVSDFVFVGTGYPSRIDYLSRMNFAGMDAVLLGNWQAAADTPLAKLCPTGVLDQCVDNDKAADWYRGARSSINVYRREHGDDATADGWSMGPREIELAACGTFFVTEERPENRAVIPMVPRVDNPEEASSVIRWHLEHDSIRRDVADRARAAIAGWTFTNRAREMLTALDT